MNKLQSFFLTIVLLCSTLNLVAQQVKGRVTDDNNKPIAFASVVVRSADRATFINFAQTDKDGIYHIQLKKEGWINIEYSILSYEIQQIDVKIESDETIVKNIVLTSSSIELAEVEIKPNTPVIIKKDTVVFNVAPFLKGNERVVEDVLKQLPGIEVSQDGVVRVNGQEVEKIMIEGDDLFQKGYALMTRSMPSNPIAQVELVQRYSENKLMKEVENSNKVALNLKLSDGEKSKPFGSLNLEGGIKNKYSAQGSVISINKNFKGYLSGGSNNVGYSTLSDASSRIIHDGDKTQQPVDVKGDKLIDIDMPTLSLSDNRYSSDRNDFALLSAMWKLNHKLKMHLWAHYNRSIRSIEEIQTSVYTSDELSFINKQTNAVGAKDNGSAYKLKFTYDISAHTMLESTSHLSLDNSYSTKHILFNESPVHANLKTKNHFYHQSIVLTSRTTPNNVWQIRFNYVNDRLPQHYYVDSVLFKNIASIDQLQQDIQTKLEYADADIQYIRKLQDDHTLKLNLGTSYRRELLGVALLDDKEKFNQTMIKSYFDVVYRKKIDHISIGVGVAGNQYWNSNSHHSTKSQFVIEPKALFDWHINSKNLLRASYFYTYKPAMLRDVAPLYVLTDFNSMMKGSGDMKLFANQGAMLNYQLGSWSSSSFLNVNVLYFNSFRYYGSNLRLTQNYTVSEVAEFKNKYLFDVSLSYDQFISTLSSNLKLKGGYTRVSHSYRINSSTNQHFISSNYTYDMSLRTMFTGLFNCNIGFKGTYVYTNKDQSSYQNYNLFSDIYFIFNPHVNMEINTEYYFQNKQVNNTRNSLFIDAKINFSAISNKLLFSLTGRNLSNTTKFDTYSITETYRTFYTVKLLPRMILLGIEYRF